MSAHVSSNNQNKQAKWLFIPIVLALALTACDQGKPQGGPGASAPPPPSVGYVVAQAQNIGLASELPGRLEASRVADVRARVAGVIERRIFAEGSDVKAGQALYQIDNAPYRANLQSAQAQLAQAQASLMQTKAQVERYKPLVAVNAISKLDYDNALAAQKASEANVAAAQAAITTAKINLGYAAVTSPISGRIGRALVTEGALVGQGDVTQLAVVQQIDPLYVNFTQSATDVIKLQQDVRSGHYRAASDGSIPISVVLDDGTVYEQKGSLVFTDLTVDKTSGQVTLRATLPNPDKLLLPGLYVRVRLEQVQAENAFLVPQQAVTRNQTGDSLFVITPENTVVPRQVTVGGRNGTNWVVIDGLNEGDRVMVDGFQKWQMTMQRAMQQHAASGAQGMPAVVVNPVLFGSEKDAAAGHMTVPSASGNEQHPPEGQQAPAVPVSGASSS